MNSSSSPFSRFLAISLLAVASVFTAVARPENAPDETSTPSTRRQTVGLVLSGGGAKGIAEIGAIQALEENDIPIDFVAGTSMGAIVGGLYASGYSPADMMELMKSRTFLNASTGTIDSKYYYLFFRPAERPSMLNVSFGNDPFHRSRILPSSLISPMPMNFSFMSIFAAHTAQCEGDFDNLFVPLRTVASDMTHHRRKVFASGRLDDAVRASMSFPIVFKPIRYEGALLYDGGIYDNFPVDVMRGDFHPDIMIGLDVHTPDSLKTFPDIVQQLDMLVTRPTNSYDLPEDEGVKIHINCSKFSLLDFPKAQEIYELGYNRMMEMIDSVKTRVTARRPAAEVARRRAEFNRTIPPVRFDSVRVIGATPEENDYIAYQFKSEAADTFGLISALDAYTKVISTGQIRDLDPTANFNPSTRRFSLDLQAEVKDKYYVGVGGYVTSSSNSMLYVGAGYRSMSFRTVDANFGAWVGQSYMAAEFSLRAMLRRRQSSSFGFQAVVWRQKFHETDKLFFQTSSPSFVRQTEAFARADFGMATGHRSMIDFSLAYGHRDNRYYINEPDIAATTKNKSMHNMGQLATRFDYSTLDNELYPTSGRSLRFLLQGVMERYRPNNSTIAGPEPQIALFSSLRAAQSPLLRSHTLRWGQAELHLRDYFSFSSRWSLGLESQILWSSRRLDRDYAAAIVEAPDFVPTPSSYNYFNPYMHANSFVTLGVVPIFKISDRISIRAAAHGFLPFREIQCADNGSARYGKWFHNPRFFGELAGVVRLPFGNLTLYGTYRTSPSDRWSIGVSFGYFILAPKLTRL